METEKKTVELKENPITLNYAVTCAAFNLEDNQKILLVDYQEKDCYDTQKKLPGGRFQAEDLISSVELFLKENGRNSSLEFLCLEIDKQKRIYLSQVANAQNHSELNFYFNKFTEKALIELQSCNLSEIEFKKILKQTHLNTVIHELKEETNAQEIGDLYISSISNHDYPHYKIGFVSTAVKAPVSYIGSPDRKIKGSGWCDIYENTVNTLFNGHKNNFQEGIREAIKLNIHSRVSILEKFLTAVN